MNIRDFKLKKQQRQKISMLTCYDYPSALIIAPTAVDCVLVGDSVAMAVHGHNSTIMADIEMMVLHTKAVARGIAEQFIVADLPFLSHRSDRHHLMKDVKALMQAGAQAIKIEGGDAHTVEVIQYLVASGIPVMGHIGLTPQSIHQLGGFVVQGKDNAQQDALIAQAEHLESAGCFALVIECTPSALAKIMTQSIQIPSIGIGAGPDTDGQVLVWHDMLGLQDSFHPRFLKRFGHLKETIQSSIREYDKAVKEAHFPCLEHCY